MGTAQVKSKNVSASSLVDPPKTQIQLQIDCDKQINPNLLQLTDWSFPEIRNAVQVYQRISSSPMADSFLFYKMMPFSKKNCDLIFSKLSQGEKYISVYELIGILVLTSYQTFKKKFQFLQLLFDFGKKKKITGKEFMLIYYSILYGYCRLSEQHLPKFNEVEQFGQATFFPGDQEIDIVTKLITLRKCIEEYEANPKISELFNRFEHPEYKEIKEDFVIFTHSEIRKYQPDEIQKLYRIINKAYRKNNFEEVHLIENNQQMRRNNRRDSCLQKLKHEKQMIIQPYKFQTPIKKKSHSLAKINSPQLSSANFRLKKLENTDPKALKHNPTKTMIFLNGQTYNKREMLESIAYFKTLSETEDCINIKEFFKKFAKKAFLKKQVSNLFKFLDYKQTGIINIEDYFRSLYPGVTNDDLKLLNKWFNLYKEIYEADSLSINQVKVVEMSDGRILPSNTLDRIKEVFRAMDMGNKGYLNFDDLRKSYKRGFTADQLQKLLVQYGKNGLIRLGGLCKMLLPEGWQIQGVNIQSIS